MSIGGVNNNVNNEAVRTKTITRKLDGVKTEIVISFAKDGTKTYTANGQRVFVSNDSFLGKKSFTKNTEVKSENKLTQTVSSQLQDKQQARQIAHNKALEEMRALKEASQNLASANYDVDGGELAEVVITGKKPANKSELNYDVDGGELAEVVITGKKPANKPELNYDVDGGELAEVVITGKKPANKSELNYDVDGGELAEVVITGKKPANKSELNYDVDGGELAEVVITGKKPANKSEL
ncbi:MAG: hypothetical protein ACLSWI_05085, partial [Candidatus Gastranaerophilaceae bacterium]